MAEQQTLGLVDITWRGQQLDIEKGAKIKVGGLKQNAMPVQRKTKYAQEYEVSEITATIPVSRGMDVLAVFASGSGELQCNCDTGQSFIFADAFVTNRPEMTAGEGGKMEIHWSAGVPEVLLNG